MTVCKKKRCVWRVDLGQGKNLCSVYKCPYTATHSGNLPKVKWAGLVEKTNLSYLKDVSKRNNNKGSDTK